MYHTDTALDRDALFHDNLPLAGFFLDRIPLPSRVDRDDAHQEALLGLHRAARYFDPSRGVKFSTFAGVCVRSAVHAFVKQCRRPALALDHEGVPEVADRQPGPDFLAEVADLQRSGATWDAPEPEPAKVPCSTEQGCSVDRPAPPASDYSTWPAMLASERVADVVSISVRTLWRLVASGQFPQPVRFNRKLVRWRKADVVAWIEGGAA